MVAANPQVNPKHLQPGTQLIIPTQFIIPHIPYRGIVINLGTMRLYYFPKGKNYFYTYPVGIGRKDWSTPLGILHIVEKIKNPVWYVPQSIYLYRQKEGDPVPKVVKPGPDNPLGQYALRLSKRTYLIHDTNDPASVGVRSSAGCIHLYPEDIKELFDLATIKEPVIIINQPYLVGWSADALYMEAHLPLEEQRSALENAAEQATTLVNSLSKEGMNVEWENAKEIIQDHTGIPEVVGTRP
jgi:L,D-transpeptidase ErfK/SrfK